MLMMGWKQKKGMVLEWRAPSCFSSYSCSSINLMVSFLLLDGMDFGNLTEKDEPTLSGLLALARATPQ